MKLKPLSEIKVPSVKRAKSDPAAMELKRKYAREKLRECKLKNPEVYKASARRSHENLMADPERLAHKRSYAKKRIEKKRKENKRHLDSLSLRHHYGIDMDAYDALLLRQSGVCAICKKPEDVISYRTKQPYRLSVDHCHVTGKVRGLLCQRCNKGLGLLQDNSDVLIRAMKYLFLV